MSKMSQLAMELDEQSAELGYDGLQDALNNGYTVVYDEDDRVHLEKIDIEKEQEKAHKAWLKEKEEVIDSLNNAIYHNRKNNDGKGTYEQIVMQRAKEFIEKGEV